jgi:hypothetical protein
MKTLCLHSALKTQQWEIAKGHLRAVVALDGAVTSKQPPPYHFERVSKAVEDFIKDFESQGFHEGID